jgi:ribosomal protein L34E
MTDRPIPPGAALAALRKPSERVCAVCGAPFTGLGRARYCSPACAAAAHRAAVRAYDQRKRARKSAENR